MCGIAELLLAQLVMHADGGGIGLEADHHSGAVAAEIPHGGRHRLFRAGGQTIKPTQPLLIGQDAAFDAPRRHVMPLQIVRRGLVDAHRGIELGDIGSLLGGNKAGEGQKDEQRQRVAMGHDLQWWVRW